jgi:hypothetical protein
MNPARRASLLPVVFALTTATALPAAAQTTSPAPVPSLEQPAWGHRTQLSLRIAGAEGYRLAIKYADGGPCSLDGTVFCHGRAPVLADLALGFGVADTIEAEGRFRLGEPEWNGSVPLAAGLGVRLYGNARSRLKFVFGFAALVDFTDPGSASAASFRTDLQGRLEEGIHYEINRHLACYFQAGETIGVLRAFMLTVDAGFGFQVRVP